ncbi:man(5)GlcNAc(2)-PP-dolichol translocation protein RFT1 isoform X2 [Rhodnius prolixus]|uniref:man(5)GlcNAc(2)-PP-dolichol translocation protein RFT1 isoform X2 n=1 Tax=Rhodnius prolixus TaxID=13249 RepID=UPI003D18B15C
MGKNFLKSSLHNASFNIIFQVGFRIVTFLLNAFVLRNISQAVLGVMNVRLLLLESTILFLSREAFRRACLTRSTEHNWPQVINLLWITVPLCIVQCIIFGAIWLYVLSAPDRSITNHYSIGVWAICVSCVLGMCVEPMYLVAQAFLFVKLRVLIESLSVSLRTIIFTCLVLWKPNAAVVAFSVAQIVGQICYTSAYCVYFHNYINKRKQISENKEEFPFNSLTDFLPKWIPGQPTVDIRLCTLTWSFLKQGILKQILTEGERYVMTLFNVLSFYEQGIYDVVNNLGSLAARFLFRPIEESAYFYFTQLVHRDKPIRQQNEEQMAEAALVLKQLLRCVSSLGILVIFFGQSYSKLLLLFYGGKSLADSVATVLLRTHCFAVFLLALNGTTECFALATMNASQINRYNQIMAYLSFGFLVISWILTKILGSVGFIIANCCNMAARIIHSVVFIKKKYEKTKYDPLNGIVPGMYFLTSVAISGLVTLVSERLILNCKHEIRERTVLIFDPSSLQRKNNSC